MSSTSLEQQNLGIKSFWADLREAVAGSQQDFTEGSLPRAIVLLSVPMVLEMAMESVFGILDVFWVGRLGPGAVATVGVTEALLTLIFAAALGVSLSTTATVAFRAITCLSSPSIDLGNISSFSTLVNQGMPVGNLGRS